MTILVIRHCVSIGNEQEIHQGQCLNEKGLSPKGFRQAFRVAEFLGGVFILKLWSSPLPRAMQTARVIKNFCNPLLKIIEEPGLMEVTNGVLDGLSYAEAKVKFPEGWDRIKQKVLHQCCFSGGESIQEVAERGKRTLQKIARLSFPLPDNHYNDESSSVVVVTHGTWLQATLTSLMDYDLREYGNFQQDNGCINFLKWTWRGLEVKQTNFVAHLGDTRFSPEFKF